MADWQELTLTVAAEDADWAESALTSAGAHAVSFDASNDAAVLEPAPGAVTLWPQVNVTGLFDEHDDLSATRQLLDLQPRVTATAVRHLGDRAWEREWLAQFKPQQFGANLWVAPRGQLAAPAVDDVVVELDPGLAFGTGNHATTALCLEALAASPPRRQVVTDFGCGSGILAIAALKLGARHVHCIDIDPQAVQATLENAATNQVADRISIETEAHLTDGHCDLLLANILLQPLLDRSSAFQTHVNAGGRVVLSGVLAEQQPQLQAGFDWLQEVKITRSEDWIALEGRAP